MLEAETDLAPITPEPGAGAPRDPSIAQDLRQLAAEANTPVQAEFTLQKSRAAFVGAEARAIVLLLVAAAVLVFFAVMACVVGTVIALGPVIGPWGAMVAVTLTLLVIAAIGAWSARSKLKRTMTIIGGKQDA